MRGWFLVSALLGCFIGFRCANALEPIKVAPDGSQFILESGAPFKWRGVDYFTFNPNGPYANFNTFDPDVYDESETARVLAQIKESQYNIVRVLLTGYLGDRGFDLSIPGISQRYVANITSFLSIAARQDIRVVLTGFFRGGRSAPRNFLTRTEKTSNLDENNRLMLDSDYADAISDFYKTLLIEIANLNSEAFSAIVAVDLYNEPYFDLNAKPFNCECGSFTINGQSYGLASYASRQALADASTTRWVRTILSGIRAVSSNILTTVSIFPNTSFGHPYFDGGKLRNSSAAVSPYPLRPSALIAGGINYLDVHLYVYPSTKMVPAMHDDLQRISHSLELDALPKRVPIVAGELGAYRRLFPSAKIAIPEIRETMTASCKIGIIGWLFWMWNGPGDTWTLSDDESAIDHAISPRAFPDPCSKNSDLH